MNGPSLPTIISNLGITIQYRSRFWLFGVWLYQEARSREVFVERAQNGDFILASSEIADRFGLSLAEFRRYMQLGFITCSVEVGTVEHEGTRRLSLRLGNRLWRAVLDDENKVQHEEMTFLGRKLSRRLPR
jgi:hypothetical protein